MRKLYMPLLSLAVAITGASAQTVIAPSAVETKSDGCKRIASHHAPSLSRNTGTSRRTFPASASKLPARHAPALNEASANYAAPSGPIENPTYIDQKPEGENRIFTKDGLGYGYNWLFGMWTQNCTGSLVEVVYAPDGKTVYINPAFSQNPTPGWLIGSIDGDEVSFSLPQLANQDIYYDDDGVTIVQQYDDYAMKVKFVMEDPATQQGWYYPTEDQTFRFKINSDGTWTSKEPDAMLGLCSWMEGDSENEAGAWSWQAIGDTGLSMSPLTTKTVDVPKTAVFEDWNLISGITAASTPVCIDGDKVYLKGIFNNTAMADAAIEGTLDRSTNKITFPGGQYLGEYWDNYTTAYFVTATYTGSDDNYRFNISDAITFDYDPVNKRMSSKDAIVISVTDKSILYYEYFIDPLIKARSTDFSVNRLLTPVYDIYYEEDIENGFCAELYFYIPLVDADANVLDKSKIYWNLIMDDEIFTFYPDEYLGLSEAVTNVPYGFTSDDGIDISAMGQNHGCLVYPEGYENLGIRMIYIDDDKTVESDIMWVPGFKSSLRDVTVRSSEVRSVRYYDLHGRLVNDPSNGLYIRQTTFADGHTESTKIAKRH